MFDNKINRLILLPKQINGLILLPNKLLAKNYSSDDCDKCQHKFFQRKQQLIETTITVKQNPQMGGIRT